MDPSTKVYPIRFFVTIHRTTGDFHQELEEYAQGQYRVIGPEILIPGTAQAPPAPGQTGFLTDGRPVPGGGQEVNMPDPMAGLPIPDQRSLNDQQGGIHTGTIQGGQAGNPIPFEQLGNQ